MTVPETTGRRRFLWPWEYYSSATPEPVLPRWATFGCAALSVFVLVLVFIGGAYLAGGGFNDLMDLTLGMSLGEMRGAFASDIPAERKKLLEDEIATMRKNLREERIPAVALQPFLETLRSAISDKRITAEETTELEQAARKINASAKPQKK